MKAYDTFSPTIPHTDNPLTYDPISSVSSGQTTKEQRKKDGVRKVATKEKGKTAQDKKSEGISFFVSVKKFITGQTARWLMGLAMGFLAVYLGVAFLSYFADCFADQSEINNTTIGYSENIQNMAGEGGARLSEFLINECFGLGSIVLIVWLFAMALKQLVGRPRFKAVNFTIKSLVALITVSLIIGLVTIGMQSSINWGGFHGRYVNEFVIRFLGWTGAVILCLFMISSFVVICMRDIIKWGMKIKRERERKRQVREELRREREAREMELAEMRKFEDADMSPASAKVEDTVATAEIDQPVVFDQEESLLYSTLPDFDQYEYSKESTTGEYVLNENEDDSQNVEDIDSHFETGKIMPDGVDGYVIEEKEGRETAYEKPADRELLNSDIKQDLPEDNYHEEMVVNVNSIAQTKGSRKPEDYNSWSHPYKFPPYELLRAGEEKVNVDTQEQLDNKEKIKKTLLSFNIPILSIEATVGPTVTLYEIVPDKGVKVSKIRSLVDDIALSLSAEGVRIIAPIPGKGTVGIEVANKEPQTVSMRTILKSRAYQSRNFKLPLAMGSTISNEVFIADLAKMPHLLVAGATGQGKSVGLNAIIASLLYSKTPDELKFVMIDPKMVEFSLYAKIEKHYLAKIPDAEDAIITDMDNVVATLSSLCVEMDNRYQLLKEAHTRNIIEYNAKIKEGKLNPKEGHRFLPYIVVIVDEFSDLIMTAGKEVEIPIARLAQKARAVGMHVIIATQRPSTNVITGIIKANFPARIAFKVSSGVDSKTILDFTGAQQLIGRGDMLVSNNAPIVRVQCAFIDTPEVEEICDYIEKQPYGQGAYILPEPKASGGDSDSDGGSLFSTDRDPLFEEVARLVVTSKTASTSSLQRRYSIGYNRAGKIMDQLEAAGVVGPAQGGKPRSVLMDPVALENLLNSMDL